MPSRVTLHGDLAHTVEERGLNSPLQARGLGESIAYEQNRFRALVDVGCRGAGGSVAFADRKIKAGLSGEAGNPVSCLVATCRFVE